MLADNWLRLLVSPDADSMVERVTKKGIGTSILSQRDFNLPMLRFPRGLPSFWGGACFGTSLCLGVDGFFLFGISMNIIVIDIHHKTNILLDYIISIMMNIITASKNNDINIVQLAPWKSRRQSSRSKDCPTDVSEAI